MGQRTPFGSCRRQIVRPGSPSNPFSDSFTMCILGSSLNVLGLR
jgi:hypothetical protein